MSAPIGYGFIYKTGSWSMVVQPPGVMLEHKAADVNAVHNFHSITWYKEDRKLKWHAHIDYNCRIIQQGNGFILDIHKPYTKIEIFEYYDYTPFFDQPSTESQIFYTQLNVSNMLYYDNTNTSIRDLQTRVNNIESNIQTILQYMKEDKPDNDSAKILQSIFDYMTAKKEYEEHLKELAVGDVNL